MAEGRRRPMLSHQMSVIRNPPKFRDNVVILRGEREEDEGGEESHEILTHASAQSYSSAGNTEKEEIAAASSRTLFDIIQDEESSAAFAYKGVFGGRDGGGTSHKLNWKGFKDRNQIRRTGAEFSCSPVRSVPVSYEFECPSSPRPPLESRPSIPRVVEAESEVYIGPDQGCGEEEVVPGKVSLMALLEQTDSHLETEDEEEGEGEGEEEEGEECVCCVCMVRHKGAAFVPCGHTFCRLCSREMWVSRGNCPLCNSYILEILDIF